jgi:hypothetical protein
MREREGGERATVGSGGGGGGESAYLEPHGISSKDPSR